jgi:isopenicillin-N N-acyltransferase-like protein
VTLPVLHLDGAAYDQGRQHGLALAERIAANLDTYFDRFQREGHLTPSEARERAEHFLPLLRDTEYFEGMRGVADGAEQHLVDILALNVRYELLYFQFGYNAMVDGCTAFAALPQASANGHLLLGQNWDWIPQVLGAVVHTVEPDGLETLSFTEAGIVGGKIGLNSAGVGLAINGLLSNVDDWSRPETPFHVRCYEILRSRSFDTAMDLVSGTPRACSTNFVLAQAPDQAIDLEAAPDTLARLEPRDGLLVHANHFLDPARLGIVEPPAERRPHSLSRQARLQAILDARAPVAIGDLEIALRDHDDYPDSVCRHLNPDDAEEERYITVTSVIMDLQDLSLRLTDGPPCEHLYDGYSLPHTAMMGR